MEGEIKQAKMKKKVSFKEFKAQEPESSKRTRKSLSKHPTIITSNLSIREVIEPPTPRINIEKIVEALNDIVEELDNKKSLKTKNAEWVLKEVISNKMFNYEPNLSSNSKEESRFLELFSPNFESDVKKEVEEPESEELNLTNHTRYQKSSTLISKSDLINLDNFGPYFDVFDYADTVGRENLMRQIVLSVFNFNQLIKLLKSSSLINFTESLRKGYSSEKFAYYHNDFHSCDVAQGMLDMFNTGKLDEIAELSNLDVLSTLFAAIIHDFKHPGLNNGFLINTQNEIAIIYNDKSCLENFHVSEAFKLLKDPQQNIFEKLDTSDLKLVRKRVVEAVLATDMMNHSKLIGIMTSRLYLQYKESDHPQKLSVILEENKEINKFDIQQDYINFVLHAIDIGHAAKPFELELKWSKLVSEEFYNQGDIERSKGLPISFLCDRATASLPGSQVGFINGIVYPTFLLVARLLPPIDNYLELIKNSRDEWEKLKQIS